LHGSRSMKSVTQRSWQQCTFQSVAEGRVSPGSLQRSASVAAIGLGALHLLSERSLPLAAPLQFQLVARWPIRPVPRWRGCRLSDRYRPLGPATVE
jgi:hypothetical protein